MFVLVRAVHHLNDTLEGVDLTYFGLIDTEGWQQRFELDLSNHGLRTQVQTLGTYATLPELIAAFEAGKYGGFRVNLADTLPFKEQLIPPYRNTGGFLEP